VKEGSRLLEASDLRIKEIAIEVGYTNRRQFERDFKRLSGTTPNSLRESRRALCKK
jgi:transcriptional regulator GlxA family with amidase domain